MGGSAAGSAEPRLEAEALERAVAVLRRGGLVVAATETLLGLLADPFQPDVLRRLAALKERPPDQPFPLLLPDPPAAARVARAMPDVALRLAARFWPGPLTLLLPALPGLPAELVGPDGLVAVRFPGPAPATDICVRFGGPLVATSANVRGALPPDVTEGLDPAVAAAAELIVPGRAAGTVGSTIVACRPNGYRIVRAGAVDEAAIRGALA
jgi:L-threonylcarbamoyladenylate synthase